MGIQMKTHQELVKAVDDQGFVDFTQHVHVQRGGVKFEAKPGLDGINRNKQENSGNGNKKQERNL